MTSCSLSSTSSSTSSCLTSYTAPSTASTVTITATYSGDSTHAASSGTSSLTLRAFVKQSSGLVASDPLNNVTLNQQQLQAQSRYWTYGGSAQGENAPYSFYEDSQGFHIGVQAVAQGRYAGLYASNLNVPGQLFHAVITGPTQTVPAGVYNTGLYVQTSDGRINYVFCGEVTTASGTVWEVASATGNTSFATSFTILWLDSSPNQPLTRSCTLVTNGSNSLLVYMDNTQVYSNSTLNLQMTGPFQVYLEVQSSYAGQLLIGTFTNFYATTGTSISVTNLPSNAATVQLVGPSGTVLASSPVSNGVATLDIGNNTFPLSARIVVKSADGTTLVSSAVVFLWGGDTYAMASG